MDTPNDVDWDTDAKKGDLDPENWQIIKEDDSRFVEYVTTKKLIAHAGPCGYAGGSSMLLAPSSFDDTMVAQEKFPTYYKSLAVSDMYKSFVTDSTDPALAATSNPMPVTYC